MTLLLLSLLACVPEAEEDTGDSSVESPSTDIFIGKWWEVTEGVSHREIDDACFLFYEIDYTGGSLMKYKEENNWPYFSVPSMWEYTDKEDVFLIGGSYKFKVTRKGNRCWNIKYKIWSAVACECSLDLRQVAQWSE